MTIHVQFEQWIPAILRASYYSAIFKNNNRIGYFGAPPVG